MYFIKKVFGHRHCWTCTNGVYHSSKFNLLSASPMTAKIYKCKCGLEKRRLTEAGKQQLRWGDDINELLGYING